MTDFTIRVKNLPHHKYYGDSDEVLKAILMIHFQEVIKDELKLMQERKAFIDRDGDGVNDMEDFTKIGESARGTLKALDWEVADITFGKSETKTMEFLTQMSTIQQEHTRKYIQGRMTSDTVAQTKIQ